MKIKSKIIDNLEVFEAPVTEKQWFKVMNDESKGIRKKYPVVRVSAYEAEEFCKKLGDGWRLPTEEEWVSFADDGFKYSGSDNPDEVAVYDRNKIDKVKTKKPNLYGLYDCSGLVLEWTSTKKGSDRVVRGGSWYDDACYCEVSIWGCNTPGYSFYDLGFRPVRINRI